MVSGTDAAGEPLVGAGDGSAGKSVGGTFGHAVIEGHNNVCTDVYLRLSGRFRGKEMFGAVDVRGKFYAFVRNFGMQALDLEPTRIGEDGMGPVHEFVNSPHLFDIF